MAILFFDTSALVKRYHEEDGTDEVDQLIEGEDTVVISSLSIIETVSAFRRKYNRDQIGETRMNQLLSKVFVSADSGLVSIAEQHDLDSINPAE